MSAEDLVEHATNSEFPAVLLDDLQLTRDGVDRHLGSLEDRIGLSLVLGRNLERGLDLRLDASAAVAWMSAEVTARIRVPSGPMSWVTV